MTIIHITPETLIAPESAFAWQQGATVMDALIIPRPAGLILAIRHGVPVKAGYHRSSQTYGFVWHHGDGERAEYRALTDIPGCAPLVLTAIEEHDHWQTCKECRDGRWCTTGTGLIVVALEGGAS